ncbi:MAG: response regulator, partial [Candidatus Omnitrophica bacterium]|nr:response regulator [Candidatus Omnitrophota bacterium]
GSSLGRNAEKGSGQLSENEKQQMASELKLLEGYFQRALFKEGLAINDETWNSIKGTVNSSMAAFVRKGGFKTQLVRIKTRIDKTRALEERKGVIKSALSKVRHLQAKLTVGFSLGEMKFKVLVVDDHEVARESVRTIFTDDKSLEISMASNGEEALKKFKKEGPFDIVITDVNMPGMSGLELARKLRGNKPDVHIIVRSLCDLQNGEKKEYAGSYNAFVLKSDTPQLEKEVAKAKQAIIQLARSLGEKTKAERFKKLAGRLELIVKKIKKTMGDEERFQIEVALCETNVEDLIYEMERAYASLKDADKAKFRDKFLRLLISVVMIFPEKLDPDTTLGATEEVYGAAYKAEQAFQSAFLFDTRPASSAINEFSQFVWENLPQLETGIDANAFKSLRMGIPVVTKPFSNLDEICSLQRKVGQLEMGFSIINPKNAPYPKVVITSCLEDTSRPIFGRFASAVGHTHGFSRLDESISKRDESGAKDNAGRGQSDFVLAFNSNGGIELAWFTPESVQFSYEHSREKIAGTLYGFGLLCENTQDSASQLGRSLGEYSAREDDDIRRKVCGGEAKPVPSQTKQVTAAYRAAWDELANAKELGKRVEVVILEEARYGSDNKISGFKVLFRGQVLCFVSIKNIEGLGYDAIQQGEKFIARVDEIGEVGSSRWPRLTLIRKVGEAVETSKARPSVAVTPLAGLLKEALEKAKIRKPKAGQGGRSLGVFGAPVRLLAGEPVELLTHDARRTTHYTNSGRSLGEEKIVLGSQTPVSSGQLATGNWRLTSESTSRSLGTILGATQAFASNVLPIDIQETNSKAFKELLKTLFPEEKSGLISRMPSALNVDYFINRGFSPEAAKTLTGLSELLNTKDKGLAINFLTYDSVRTESQREFIKTMLTDNPNEYYYVFHNEGNENIPKLKIIFSDFAERVRFIEVKKSESIADSMITTGRSPELYKLARTIAGVNTIKTLTDLYDFISVIAPEPVLDRLSVEGINQLVAIDYSLLQDREDERVVEGARILELALGHSLGYWSGYFKSKGLTDIKDRIFALLKDRIGDNLISRMQKGINYRFSIIVSGVRELLSGIYNTFQGVWRAARAA